MIEMTELKGLQALSEDIAVVGMSVNVPGSQDVDSFWKNLRAGVESIRRLDEAALLAAGESPEKLRRKNYVPAAAILEGFETFDAEFFGFSPKDAAILDPQHRKFLETAWTAMEQAGHPPETVPGPIGVYAGCGMGSYFYFNICSNPDLVDDVGMFLLRHTGNDKDFLSTRVSHVFDLKGPSINLQTACSTSLVAIHYACQALHAGEVDMALAGGVTIELPQGRGYEFKENEILSPDGHCHAFDHRAEGTVFGSGAGCVALRRLSDAIADGDHIWAVIKGSAVNNDGAAKAGYLAPSVDGQSAAIVKALDDAGVAAQSIGYVECHGTGTYLGDPIEVAALTEAYRQSTDAVDFCRIGSVKTNIGHLDTAAGVAGFVKTALSLHHGEMPPSLGYEAPNPAIAFDGSPFAVNAGLTPWARGDTPRRAGINALGVGGTNAHTIIEEAPQRAPSEDSDFPFHALCISGRSKAALDANTAALAAHLRANPDQPLADVAFTLKNGRRGFEKRRVVVAETHAEAADLLEGNDTRRVFTHDLLGDAPQTVFMFPGGGAQYPDMARDLYETEPVFAEWMDRGLEHLQAHLDYDIRALWLPAPEDRAAAEERLKTPSAQLPLIAIVEYALAQLWISWGVRPAALVGHSMGENVAACLAGVMRFEDLIDLVLLRGRLFDSVAPGGMLSISLSLEETMPLLGDDLDIASVNAPRLTAVSGPDAALDRLQDRLSAQGIDWQRIAIDIAAHSRMLEPILHKYRDILAGLDLQAPQIDIVSNRTGQPLTQAQACDPDYWVEQLRNTVRFAQCMDTLAETKGRVFLEVGPGKALAALAQMNAQVLPAQVLSSLRHPDQDMADDAYFIGVVGRLWACGVEADWTQIWGEARRNRVLLPTYQFQRASYFIEPGAAAVPQVAPMARHDDMADWGYVPEWRPRYADVSQTALATGPALTWLIFEDDAGVAAPAIARLRAADHSVTVVRGGDGFADLGGGVFTLAPEQGRDGYDALIAALQAQDRMPDRIGHFWLAADEAHVRPGSSVFDSHLDHGFYCLLGLGQALIEAGHDRPLHLSVFTKGAAQVADEPLVYPEKAMISGPAGVLPRELAGLTCAVVDLEMVQAAPKRRFFGRTEDTPALDQLTDRMLDDLLAEPANSIAAYRGAHRLEQGIGPSTLPDVAEPGFVEGGTYLITGGFGGIGQTIAADLLSAHKARVIHLSRTPLPPRETWTHLLSQKPAGDPVARRIRAVERLAAMGGTVEVACGDVINVAQMRSVIEGIEGRIDGVIHAAGALNDAPMLAKSPAEVDAVIAPKVQGLRVLDQLLPDGSVDLMVLFASTSTATRMVGQVDYVAANEYLNAFAKSRKDAKTKVVAVNWGVWADVGMAAEAVGGAPIEVMPARNLTLPLLTTAASDPMGIPVFSATLDAKDSWVLDQHRVADGSAVMPGTGMIEAFAEAGRAQGISGAMALRDLYFLRALSVAEDAPRDMRIWMRTEQGGYAAELRSACVLNGKPGWQLHAQAHLTALRKSDPKPIDLNAIAARCGDAERAPEGGRLRSPQETHLAFGPQWHVLRARRLGDGEGLAELSLDASDVGEHVLHPGLMDLATGWAIALAPGYDGSDLWVPVSYGEITVHAPLPQQIVSWMRLSGSSGGNDARFDVTIATPDGTVLAEITDFSMTRLEGGFAAQDTSLDPREVHFDDARTEDDRQLSPAEERLAYAVSQGITAAEGPDALARALSTGHSQIYVSSLPLDGLIAQADTPIVDTHGSGQSFERPDLDGSFVAPRNGIEEKLAAIWENLLGVTPVGVEDSFFDLGGHSLIAVRLFATVKREFGVEFPISILFEAPSIAECAALIAAETGDAGELTDTGAAPSEAQPRFAHLVPLNGRKPKDAHPIFVVAGMFGNVLNLRHLALQFGEERAVYGLQARGLTGDTAPHTTVEAAAQDYIAEMRMVQPDGPYLLAGYSGGGITAYEMAQQLRQSGEEVGMVVMLDTPLPVRPSLSRPDKAMIKLAELRRKGPGYVVEWARNRWDWEKQKRGAQPIGPANPEAAFNNEKIEMAFRSAVEVYDVTPWNGPLTLFRPPLDRHWSVTGGQWVSAAKEYVFADNDWTQYAPQIEVIEVPGDHDSMVLAPNVTVLADEIRHLIAELGIEERHQTSATAAE